MAKRSRNKKNQDKSNIHMIKDGLSPSLGNQKRDRSYTKNIKPRSPGQKQFMESMEQNAVTFAVGPAGTGKTYLAIAKAIEYFESGAVDRIILTRPAIESGESLGYLPGDLVEKMAPYLRPLFDSLIERIGTKRLKSLIDTGDIEIAPVAYMRGRTLNRAFVVIDEAQNCTYGQLKMLLSRLGWQSRMIITGDPDQSDLMEGLSGLSEACERLDNTNNLSVVRLSQVDIVRHPLVAEMLNVL